MLDGQHRDWHTDEARALHGKVKRRGIVNDGAVLHPDLALSLVAGGKRIQQVNQFFLLIVLNLLPGTVDREVKRDRAAVHNRTVITQREAGTRDAAGVLKRTAILQRDVGSRDAAAIVESCGRNRPAVHFAAFIDYDLTIRIERATVESTINLNAIDVSNNEVHTGHIGVLIDVDGSLGNDSWFRNRIREIGCAIIICAAEMSIITTQIPLVVLKNIRTFYLTVVAQRQ